VILVDANLLIYSRVSSFPQHEMARSWLDSQLNGTLKVGLPWASLLGFVRLVSNPRVFERPETIPGAWEQVEEWLDCPTAWIPLPTENHRRTLAALIQAGSLRANHVPDAHLAALAIEHGLTLCSSDADFSRFAGLVWENPLI
jgi:toxin-antitoxin system PIN domain toxin